MAASSFTLLLMPLAIKKAKEAYLIYLLFIDRLVHHAYILGFTGSSFRYREAVLAKGGSKMNEGRQSITTN
jgi:hypothetical protein